MADDWQRKFEEWKRAKRLREERERAKHLENSDIVKEVVNKPKVNEESVLREVGETIKHDARAIENYGKHHRKIVFLAFAIPILVILYLLYVNFLPFGYSEQKIINVGDYRDTSGNFYLEQSSSLGIRENTSEGYFRTIDGLIYAVYKPSVILNNAKINVSIVGENVSLIEMPQLNFNWDYDWNSSNINQFQVEPINQNTLDENNCMFFDGQTRYTLSNSSNDFENNSFVVYVKYTPEKQEDSQQIVGHYNWEIWQDKSNIQFRIGRTFDNGPFYSVLYNINDESFNKEHEILAIYNPSNVTNKSGYIELWVDNNFAGRTYFSNETIWKDYGNIDLSLGWTPHNYEKSPYFQGSICDVKFAYQSINSDAGKEILFTSSEEVVRIPISGNQGELKQIELKVKQ